MIENRPNNREREGVAEGLANMLEKFLVVLLGVGAIAVLAVAIVIIATMDGGSKSQGGRFFVAIGALVALGWIDSQFARLAWRRYALNLSDSSGYRRYRILSSLLLLFAAALLMGLAFLLP